MKDRRKSKKKRRGMLVLYLVVCTAVIVIAYFHLTKIAKDYNTEHLELISGLYAEKMNETIDYLQSYAKENVKNSTKYRGERARGDISAFGARS